ncbi:MAG: aryl-sulfate sulfotransferase, partial [Bacteroidota bacterium]
MKKSLLALLFLASFSGVFGQWTPQNSPALEYTWHEDAEVCDYMFLGLFRFISPSPRTATNLILDNKGDVVYWQKAAEWMLDWKIHPNGLMSYNLYDKWYILDSTFTMIDSLKCQGYNTDVHDLIITDDGHYFLICFEDSTMDLSALTTPNGMQGAVNGHVTANVIQELDANKNIVKEWHTLDHFDVLDIGPQFFTQPGVAELNHTNSISLDQWGNMVMSHRANHEVTYVDWDSGDIIWRLGGNNNEFTFTNDIGINSQHFAQIQPDGKLSVFDNGTHHIPKKARGIVYDLDTVNMEATKVWEYTNLDLFSTSLGSFQRAVDLNEDLGDVLEL